MRGTISRGVLRWKLEMHMTFENRLYIPDCEALEIPL